MIKYMLDTNICIYLIKKKPEKVLNRFKSLIPGQVCISLITLAEMEYGASKSIYRDRSRLAINQFLSGIEVLPLNIEVARTYGEIRAELEKKGTPIGANDTLIAAHAKTLGVVLVSNNTKEFERVDGLIIENWA